MASDMEPKVRQAYLYDFYGELLNEHQRKIFEAFVFDDLSLGEIAEEQGISRQGVHDQLKRCHKILEEYESKLHLLSRFLQMKQKAEEIARVSAEAKSNLQHMDRLIESLERIECLSADILEEL